MEEEEMVESLFKRAAEHMRNNSSLKLTTEQKLNLYGLFKQASMGPCKTSKPGIFDMTGRAKWENWHRLGSLSKSKAMADYIDLVAQLDPNWREKKPHVDRATAITSKEPGEATGGGPVISTLMKEDQDIIPNEKKTVFDWCKEGNITQMAAMVTEKNINVQDKEGLSLLHWSCDRGHVEVVEFLLTTGIDVNLKDAEEEQTALHYAASCGHDNVIKLLLSHPHTITTLKDHSGNTPAEVTSEPSILTLLNPHHP